MADTVLGIMGDVKLHEYYFFSRNERKEIG